MELAENIMCGRSSIMDLYGIKQRHIAVKLDGNEGTFIQGSSGPNYKSSHTNLRWTVEFLILYDLWQQDERISDFYRTLSNEEVSPFFNSYLHYSPGTATAEDELLQSYNQHFELEGRNALDARIDRAGHFWKTAVFNQGHLKSMTPRVCNILRQRDEDMLPRVYIEDGIVVERHGERTFIVTLDSESDGHVSMTWQAWDMHVYGDGDPVQYIPDRGSLTFVPGERSKDINIKVKVVDDYLVKSDDAFRVVLKQASRALLSDSIGEAPIIDNDKTVINPVPAIPDDTRAPMIPDDNEGFEGASENREKIANREGGCALALKEESENITQNSLFNPFVIVFALFVMVNRKWSLRTGQSLDIGCLTKKPQRP